MAQAEIGSLIELLRARGDAAYFGERVSVLEHSLQCAYFAARSANDPVSIAAGLLHDIGHLLHEEPEDAAARGRDTQHEELAARYLGSWFGPAVTEPIRLHVAAKRYLCAIDRDYLGQLSASSIESLELQGGPMTSEEIHEFQALPHWSNAVQLRRWDDEAKLVDLRTPGPEEYLEQLRLAAAIAPPGS
jgi:phosphonate degradation associated HDIG domain protein